MTGEPIAPDGLYCAECWGRVRQRKLPLKSGAAVLQCNCEVLPHPFIVYVGKDVPTWRR